MSKPHFKPYIQNQPYLIPPSWDEYILPNHPVRVIDSIVEQINLDELYQTYKTIGNSPYSPKMLLKLIIYSYLNNIYSSRKIEEAARSSLFCIWLCGGNLPDHNTISRFRQIKVEVILKDIFKQIVLLLAEQGLVSLDEAYIDGTKIEANANKFTFVWKNSIKYHKEQMLNR
jgi:transposase